MCRRKFVDREFVDLSIVHGREAPTFTHVNNSGNTPSRSLSQVEHQLNHHQIDLFTLTVQLTVDSGQLLRKNMIHPLTANLNCQLYHHSDFQFCHACIDNKGDSFNQFCYTHFSYNSNHLIADFILFHSVQT